MTAMQRLESFDIGRRAHGLDRFAIIEDSKSAVVDGFAVTKRASIFFRSSLYI